MKDTLLSGFPERYAAALRSHLEQESDAPADLVREIGRESLALGLETLDMAKIHQSALAALVPPDGPAALVEERTRRAALFFIEAVRAIEETHPAALEANNQLTRLTETLQQLTQDLADSQRELREGILERKSAEAAFKASSEHSSQLLVESLLLEEHLQEIAHQILSAQEEERKKISLQLHDDIAQTLLGIQVRLLALKTEAASNNAGLNKEIAITQRLVEQSVKTINRFARELGIKP